MRLPLAGIGLRLAFISRNVAFRLQIVGLLISQVGRILLTAATGSSKTVDFSTDPLLSRQERDLLKTVLDAQQLPVVEPVFDRTGKALETVTQPGELLGLAAAEASKGRFTLARKFALLAELRSGPDSDCERRAAEYRKQRATITGQMPSDGPADFLIVPTIRAGSSAIGHFLSWHPDLAVAPKVDVDDALRDNALGKVLNASRSFRLGDPARRHGLVLHNYVPGVRWLLPETEWAGKVQALRQAVHGQRFYQVVRDPAATMESLTFHGIFLNRTLPWGCFGKPDAPGIIALDAQFDIDRLPRSPVEPQLHASVSTDVANAALEEAKQFARNRPYDECSVADAFRRDFPDWRVIDIGAFSGDATYGSLQALFKELGVGPGFEHPLLPYPQNTHTNRVLYHYFVDVAVRGQRIEFGTYFADQAMRSMDLNFIELAWREPCDDWIASGFPNRRLALVCDVDAWSALPLTVRRELFDSGRLVTLLDHVVYPASRAVLTAWWRAMEEPMAEFKKNFTPWYATQVLAGERDRLNGFIEQHPHILPYWRRYTEWVA